MKNRFVLAIIAILVLFAWNLAASDFTIEKHDDQTCTIMEYSGSKKILDIPSHIEGYKVVSIGDWAFSLCESPTSITIPDSVTSIGDAAFSWCRSLSSITIPDSIASIGDGTFYGCESLASITIPDSVTSIGEGAFSWCNALASITVDINNPVYATIQGVLFNKIDKSLHTYPIGK
ncbi:MAG: leucine-rich repeat domain-containing protein, partial [Spirochaetales bacterium]|nr:leucine-rich repeat domain-containing protein [Spirochaetales bacterium]